MQSCERVKFLTETPELHASEETQGYIRQELTRPSKAWVQEVVACARESEFVKLRTVDFVLLPDINCHRRQGRPYHTRLATRRDSEPGLVARGAGGGARRFNWLVILADAELKSIRDLRGEHIPLLERMQQQCVEAIQREYRVAAEDVMVFANYPPSVYKLHFHFCVPFFKPTAYDAFRMHTLSSILNNLRIHPDYYRLSTFQIPVHRNSDLFRVIGPPDTSSGESDGEAAAPAGPG
jgi:hypothetical protein